MRDESEPDLPDVQQVVWLLIDEVGVEQKVAVTSIEVAYPLGLYRHQIQVLNAPHLGPISG